MLRVYQEIMPLSEEERDYLAIRFSYPEKFWKLINSYYHSNKAWIPEKDVEKRGQLLHKQSEEAVFWRVYFLSICKRVVYNKG